MVSVGFSGLCCIARPDWYFPKTLLKNKPDVIISKQNPKICATFCAFVLDSNTIDNLVDIDFWK